jgi:hypothetical protein
MSNKGDIAFTNDIATSVAEELGISKEKALAHIDFMSHWIRIIAEDPQNLSIRLPGIGKLYVNINKVQKLYNHFSQLSSDEFKSSWSSKLESHRLRLEAFNNEFPDHEGYHKQKKKSKFLNMWFNKGMSFKELENWQNK